mmetsp:Transcript_58200/g.52421  ORF Transcript_58200/g.52421 Transcript_58200/m.52421 type:complete len:214 (+) Transcript_58200:103-744(+)
MATIISSNVGSSSCRRKRSRDEFQRENIDEAAIGNSIEMEQPRKRRRHSIKQKQMNHNKHNREHKEEEEQEQLLITTMNQIDIKKNLIHSNDKNKMNKSRKRSRTDFNTNHDENKMLKQLSPNKRIRTQQTENRMNIDIDDDESDCDNKMIDDEGDVSMGSDQLNKKNKNKNKQSILVNRPNRNKEEKLTTAFPPNRVNRSGLEFCVLCGIGA